MRKSISLGRLKRFAYCSMQSHLHDELRLPWLFRRADLMIHYIVRTSLQGYFAREILGTRQENAKIAMNRMERRLDRVRKRWGITPEEELMRSEFNTAISLLHKTYDATRDVVLGANLPVEIQYQYPVAGLDWTITHKMDAVFVRNRKVRGPESYVYLNITDPLDPYEQRVRYGEITNGFLSYVARESIGLETGIPIEVVDFPLSKPPRRRTLTRDGRAEFKAFADNALKLIATGAAIPIGDPAKCVICPYNGFCKPSLALLTHDQKDYAARSRLKSVMRSNKKGMRVMRPSGD